MSRDAKWYANWIRLLPASTEDEKMRNLEAADLLEELVKQVPRWISVDEQPEPAEDDEYWCYGYWIGSGRKQVESAEYLGGEWKIVNNFVLTHWMPMPELPEEE